MKALLPANGCRPPSSAKKGVGKHELDYEFKTFVKITLAGHVAKQPVARGAAQRCDGVILSLA